MGELPVPSLATHTMAGGAARGSGLIWTSGGLVREKDDPGQPAGRGDGGSRSGSGGREARCGSG